MSYKIRRSNASKLCGSANVHAVSRIALAFMVFAITAITHTQAELQESPKVSARIEAKATPDCIKVKFFLKNEGTEPVEIVYGRGGMGQDVVPEFHTQYTTVALDILT